MPVYSFLMIWTKEGSKAGLSSIVKDHQFKSISLLSISSFFTQWEGESGLEVGKSRAPVVEVRLLSGAESAEGIRVSSSAYANVSVDPVILSCALSSGAPTKWILRPQSVIEEALEEGGGMLSHSQNGKMIFLWRVSLETPRNIPSPGGASLISRAIRIFAAKVFPERTEPMAMLFRALALTMKSCCFGDIP